MIATRYKVDIKLYKVNGEIGLLKVNGEIKALEITTGGAG